MSQKCWLITFILNQNWLFSLTSPLLYTWTFWYNIQKSFKCMYVLIHLERLLRCETDNIWKMHWKLKYSESQNCFANISETKSWIYMKSYMVVNYYLVSLNFKFHKNSYSNAWSRVVNARTRDKTYVHAFTTLRAHLCTNLWNYS